MSSQGIKVETSIAPDAQFITQITAAYGPDGVRDEVMRRVLNTQDQQVRAALMALGWTPPAVEPNINITINPEAPQ